MVQFDDRALQLLSLKCDRIRRLATEGPPATWYRELAALLKWIVCVPLLRVYVHEVIVMHDAEIRDHAKVVDAALAELPMLARQLRDARPEEAVDDGYPGPSRWSAFDAALVNADSVGRSSEERSADSAKLAGILKLRAREVWKRGVDTDSGEELERLVDDAVAASETHLHRVNEQLMAASMSPRRALLQIAALARALNPPPSGHPHWTDFAPEDPQVPFIDVRKIDEEGAKLVPEYRAALDRLVEHLHVLGTSSLTYRACVERFKERCTWYDKDRMRDLAKVGSGTREDRLTLELAKYLHDCGLFVLVRPRVTNLEPDVVGLSGLAVEAKAYESADAARADILQGYHQLHAYMTSLETGAMPVREGVLVAFRLGGPIYDTPSVLEIGRFRIHSMTIDLGGSSDSGRNQARVRPITEAEILGAAEGSQ